jgi:hypothetical protein
MESIHSKFDYDFSSEVGTVPDSQTYMTSRQDMGGFVDVGSRQINFTMGAVGVNKVINGSKSFLSVRMRAGLLTAGVFSGFTFGTDEMFLKTDCESAMFNDYRIDYNGTQISSPSSRADYATNIYRLMSTTPCQRRNGQVGTFYGSDKILQVDEATATNTFPTDLSNPVIAGRTFTIDIPLDFLPLFGFGDAPLWGGLPLNLQFTFRDNMLQLITKRNGASLPALSVVQVDRVDIQLHVEEIESEMSKSIASRVMNETLVLKTKFNDIRNGGNRILAGVGSWINAPGAYRVRSTDFAVFVQVQSTRYTVNPGDVTGSKVYQYKFEKNNTIGFDIDDGGKNIRRSDQIQSFDGQLYQQLKHVLQETISNDSVGNCPVPYAQWLAGIPWFLIPVNFRGMFPENHSGTSGPGPYREIGFNLRFGTGGATSSCEVLMFVRRSMTFVCGPNGLREM